MAKKPTAQPTPHQEDESLCRKIAAFKNVIEYHLERHKSTEVPKGATFGRAVPRVEKIGALTKMFNALEKLENKLTPDDPTGDLDFEAEL